MVYLYTAQNQAANEDKGLDAPTKDDDPDGSKLFASPDGLETAAKILRPLTSSLIKYKSQSQNQSQKGSGLSVEEEVEVWVTSYDVAIRRRTSLFLSLFFLTSLLCEIIII